MSSYNLIFANSASIVQGNCGSLILSGYCKQSCLVNVHDKKLYDGINIYPNPSASEFIINSEAEIINIEIFEFTGKFIVKYETLENNSFSIPSGINGILFVKDVTNYSYALKKIVKL